MGLGMFLTKLASSSGKVSFLSSKKYPSRIFKQSLSDPGPKTDFYLHLFILWMSLWGSVWVKRTTCKSQFFLSTIWDPGIEFMSSDRCLIRFFLLFIEKQNPCTILKIKTETNSSICENTHYHLLLGLKRKCYLLALTFSSIPPSFLSAPFHRGSSKAH